MQLIRGIDQLSENNKPSVVSIGNYDGVHLGHQHVIKTLLEKSKSLQAPSTVITFEPLAREFFQPDSIMRITSIEKRAEYLFELGVDQVLCIEFNQELASSSPQDFVEKVLIGGLGVKYLCVGDDFRFGKDRAGDFEFLKKVGQRNSFEVTAHDTFTLDGQRVSSGRVREAILAADFDLAEQLLGRPFSVAGRVEKGQQLGRTIQFPTANIAISHPLIAINGVYCVSVEMLDGETPGRQLTGVANVGIRPTVDGKEKRLEVHLFDFDEEVYGQTLQVQFHKKIRDEQKFDSVELLKKQITKDAQQALSYFSV